MNPVLYKTMVPTEKRPLHNINIKHRNNKIMVPTNPQPICLYLQTRGWAIPTLNLLCNDQQLPLGLSFDDIDPHKVIMQPHTHPTKLYEALLNRDWKEASNRLKRNPKEARVWIYRETEFPKCTLLWKALPLHAAIGFGAPASLVAEILSAYKEAAKKFDAERNLPIHLAASGIDAEGDRGAVEHLLRAFPECAGVKNGRGKTALELAYEAQLKRDRQRTLKNQWIVNITNNGEREEEGEQGFEMQLEMRDAMGCYSNTVIGRDVCESAGSTKSSDGFEMQYEMREAVDCFDPLAAVDSSAWLLGETMASNCLGMDNVLAYAASSESYDSSALSTMKDVKSLGFQSVEVNLCDLSVTSSISMVSTFDTTDSQSWSFGKKSGTWTTAESSFSSQSKSTSKNCNDLKDKYLIGRNKHKKSKSFQILGPLSMARSCELPPRPTVGMYSSPVKSMPSPIGMLKSRSRRKMGKANSLDECSVGESKSQSEEMEMERERSSDDRYAVSKSESGRGNESSVSSKCKKPRQKEYRQAQSFDLPPKPIVCSSLSKSPPASLRLLKSRSGSLSPFKSSSNGSKRDGANAKEIIVNTSLPTIHSSKLLSNESNELLMRSNALEHNQHHQRLRRGQAQSFDIPSKHPAACTSPARSLPTPVRMFQSQSDALQEEEPLSNKAFKEPPSTKSIISEQQQGQSVCNTARSFDIPSQHPSACISPAWSLPASLRRIKSRSRTIESTKSKSSFDRYSVGRDSSTSGVLSSSCSSSTGPNPDLDMIIMKASVMSDCTNSSGMPPPPIDPYLTSDASAPGSAKSACSVLTEAATSPLSKPDAVRDVTTDFGLMTVAENDTIGNDDDTQSQSQVSSSNLMPHQTRLVDCVEEAVMNIGWKEGDVTKILQEMKDKNIHCVDDLLKVSSEEFNSLFEDKDFAMEMERLLCGSESSDEDNRDMVQLPETPSFFEQDQALVDFVRCALGNIGAGSDDLVGLLEQMHARNIDTMDDVLKLDSKEFASVFYRELGIEIIRLLNEPKFEKDIGDVYVADKFLHASCSEGSASEALRGQPML